MPTKRDLTSMLQQQAATIAAMQAKLGIVPSAVPAPTATATPAVPVSWLAEANAALLKAKEPRPVTAEVITVNPDAAKGQTFAPFKVLHVHNGLSGHFYRGVKLDNRFLAAVAAWVGKHGAVIK